MTTETVIDLEESEYSQPTERCPAAQMFDMYLHQVEGFDEPERARMFFVGVAMARDMASMDVPVSAQTIIDEAAALQRYVENGGNGRAALTTV